MSETPHQLASDFAPPSRASWEAEVLKVLNRRRPEGSELSLEQALSRLRTTTVDGLTIEPLYTSSSGPVGYPGMMPFTRGTTVRSAGGWDVRALHEDPDVAATNAAVLEDLQRGATSLWLRIGSDGIAADDLPAALAGVRPELAAVAVSSLDDQNAAASALCQWWRDSRQSDEVVGNLGIDPLAWAAANGETPDLSGLAHWVGLCRQEFPGARALVVDTLCYDDAGAADVEILGYAIATGVAYLRALADQGVTATDGANQLAFRVPAHADQFTTIARLRALRRLWARVGEVLDVPEASRGALQHAVTSWRMVTRDDPYVNLLRDTIATFAAAAGGAEIITVLPFDTALGLPEGFSRRMARNTQLLAAEESHLGQVADPAGGSWFVENLTDQLAERAWAVFQGIEAAGGMAQALTSGLIAEQVAATNQARAARLATRRQPITGVSMFPLAQEPPVRVRPRRPAPTRNGLRPVRDAQVFEKLRDRSVAAGPSAQVFLACLGRQRDFGPREQFTSNLLLAGGLAQPSSHGGTPDEIAAAAAASGARLAILCSSAKVYADQGLSVARALKEAGVERVLIAGRSRELGGDPQGVIDGEVFDGMDVVAFLSDTLDQVEVAK